MSKNIKPTSIKAVALFITAIVLISCSACAFFIKKERTTSEKVYEKLLSETHYEDNYMPAPDDLGEYVSFEFYFKETPNLVSASDALALFVGYEENDYYTQKANKENAAYFLENPVIYSDGDYLIPVTEFEYEGFYIRVLKGTSGYQDCQSFGMLGFDDETKTIAYLYFEDLELDWICRENGAPLDAMIYFMDKYFYWK